MQDRRLFLVFGIFLASTAAHAETGLVSGLKPHERPANAPLIASFEASSTFQAQALRGIGEPQTGVGFLKDQGAWYTPFNRPNLPGKYDIRKLHENDKRD